MSKRFALPDARIIDAVGVGTVLACAALAYGLGVHPVIDARKVVEREMARLQSELTRADTAELSLGSARRRLAALDERLSDSVRLRPAATLNDRVSRLSMLAGEYGLGIEKLTPGTAAPGEKGRGGTWVEVPMAFGGTGTFADCLLFLSDLHYRHPDMKITGMRMGGAGAGDSAGPTPVEFGFDLVWFAAPAGLAGVDDAR